ncbi:Ribonuclease H domain [Sesbania bispinosa]|nr:Ribonuclease H domain [Sesbania bispinosa]
MEGSIMKSKDLRLGKYLLPSGDWNLSLLAQQLQSHVIDIIVALPVDFFVARDTILWSLSPDGIWHARNAFIFEAVTLNPSCTVVQIHHRIAEAVCVFIVANDQSPASGSVAFVSTVWVKWNPPDLGWIKLNTDGSVNAHHHLVACGGIFRNHHGNFVLAFAQKLAPTSILEAELLAILYGLELAWTRQFNKLLVEVDSTSAIRLVQLGCKNTHALFNTVSRIQHLVKRNWLVRFHHVFREANQPVGLFAAYGLSQDSSVNLFTKIPSFLSLSFTADTIGTWFPRTS